MPKTPESILLAPSATTSMLSKEPLLDLSAQATEAIANGGFVRTSHLGQIWPLSAIPQDQAVLAPRHLMVRREWGFTAVLLVSGTSFVCSARALFEPGENSTRSPVERLADGEDLAIALVAQGAVDADGPEAAHVAAPKPDGDLAGVAG